MPCNCFVTGWQNYKAKLSGFGLAREGPDNGSTHVSTKIMGTYGYAAPEYIATGYLPFYVIRCQ